MAASSVMRSSPPAPASWASTSKSPNGRRGLHRQIRRQLPHERGVGVQQRAPRRKPALTRKCLSDEAVDERRRVGRRRYLHLHLHWRTVVAGASISATRVQKEPPDDHRNPSSRERSQRTVRHACRRRRGSADGRRPRSERVHRAPRAGCGGGQAHRSGPDPRRGAGPPRGVADARGHRDHARTRDVRPIRTDPLPHPEHGPRDAGRPDPPGGRVAGRDARQRPRRHRDRVARGRLVGGQPAGRLMSPAQAG